MKTTLLHLTALVLASTLAPCTCLALTVQPVQPNPKSENEVKLEVVHGVPVVNGVYLNGQGPYRFLLDTGSTTNQVEADLAKKLGVTVTRQLEQATASGISKVLAGTMQQVTLGEASVSGQEFMLMSGEGFHALDPSIRGILGQQFLRHFDYTLDFKHHKMIFGVVAASGDQVKFRLVAGCMSVTTDLGDLLLDSGTQNLFLFEDMPSGAHTNLTTSNGQSQAMVKRAPAVSVAGKKYYPSEMLVKEVHGAPAKGLLPATLFKSIHVSNSDGYLILNPAE